MRNYLAYFFLFVFSFQALPVKAIGRMLAKNQMTEEVKQDCQDLDDDTDDGGYGDGDDLFNDIICHHPYDFVLTPVADRHIITAFHFIDDLPNSHIADIHCPPPNC